MSAFCFFASSPSGVDSVLYFHESTSRRLYEFFFTFGQPRFVHSFMVRVVTPKTMATTWAVTITWSFSMTTFCLAKIVTVLPYSNLRCGSEIFGNFWESFCGSESPAYLGGRRKYLFENFIIIIYSHAGSPPTASASAPLPCRARLRLNRNVTGSCTHVHLCNHYSHAFLPHESYLPYIFV